MYQLTKVLLLSETLDNNGKTTRCSDTYTEALLWFVCIMWTNNGKTCVSLHTCFVWHFYGSAGIYVVCATWTVAEPNFLYKERVFAVERERRTRAHSDLEFAENGNWNLGYAIWYMIVASLLVYVT